MAETVEHQEFTENTPEADSLDLIEPSQNVNIENTNTFENVVEEKEKEVEEKLFRFPLGTIKRIVKMGTKISYYFNFLHVVEKLELIISCFHVKKID